LENTIAERQGYEPVEDSRARVWVNHIQGPSNPMTNNHLDRDDAQEENRILTRHEVSAVKV